VAAVVCAFVMIRVGGGLRELAPWAGVVGVAAIPVFYCLSLGVFGYFPKVGGIVLIQLIGLPPALWAAWVHRGLAEEERRRLVEFPVFTDGGRSVVAWAVAVLSAFGYGERGRR